MNFTLREAQLFRLLTSLLGEERVIAGMSLAAVIGDSGGGNPVLAESDLRWASDQRCLFTLLKVDDLPVAVVDFPAVDGGDIDPSRIELHGRGRELLEARGIHFFVMENEELEAIMTPGTGYSLVHYFAEQFAARGIGMEFLLDE